MNRNRGPVKQQHGFTTMQMILSISIIAIVSVFGVFGITNARAEFRLQNSARLFATYVEKARTDAIRRHAPDGQESAIETFGPGTSNYAVTMDFGTGALETRTFQLETGLVFSTAARRVTFDWRGRITEAWVFQIFSAYLERSMPVDVSGSGDITVGEQHFPDQLIPPVEVAQVTGGVDADPTPTPTPVVEATPPIEDTPPGDEVDPTPSPTPTPDGNGNGNGNGNGSDNGNGNPNPGATPTPSPTPTPPVDPNADPTPIPQCVSTISPSTLSLSQSDTSNQTGTATFTMTNATGVRIISASLLGNGNSLNLAVGLQRIDGSGSSVITVTTKQGAGNRGVFIVEVSGSPACGSAQKLTVSVSN